MTVLESKTPVMPVTDRVENHRMGEEMGLLLGDYPRDAWPDHPYFAKSISNWMGAHEMFRRLGGIASGEVELFLGKDREANEFAGKLSYYGGLLVRNLHGHHTWEDRHFFPELSTADNRFDRGLELLEGDHRELDALLEGFVLSGNRVIKLIDLEDEQSARNEGGKLLDTATGIEALLNRHLADEEDLVVPILLHHKMRG